LVIVVIWRKFSFDKLFKLFGITPEERKKQIDLMREKLDKNAPEYQRTMEQLDRLEREIDSKPR
jgi:PAB1-binding protein PBP1